MPTKSARAVCIVWLAAGLLRLAALPAGAADLTQNPARHSALGAVFAEPSARSLRIETPLGDDAPFAVRTRMPGYYGGSTEFTYRNYYGTSPITIFNRLPYACAFYASC